MRLSLHKGATRGLATFAIVLAMGVFAPELVVAQSQSQAQLTVRVQELEDNVRTLTGQVEGLQFQLTQMQELIQKMQDDNEFRFQQLEGGAGKKSSAATQSDGVTPSGASPQPDQGVQTSGGLTNVAPADNPPVDNPPPADNPPSADNPPVVVETPDNTDTLGESADPLLGKGGSGAGLETVPLGGGEARPLNLSLNSDQPISNGDADAQYQAGYDALVRGDYAFAEDQFRQFIALYPKDPQAPDAANWLGEALLQRGAYDEAADVLLSGFQNYGDSARAPDLLLKLGIALAGAGETDTACRTFFEVSKRYPRQPAAFMQRLKQERQKAKCPA